MKQFPSLHEQLKQCTVQIVVPGKSLGTGFFVAPSFILTCAHVVQVAQEQHVPIEVSTWDNQFIGVGALRTYMQEKILNTQMLPGQKIPYLYPDLAIVQVALADHPCVYLDGQVNSGDPLYTYGYPENFPGGDETEFVYEGESRIDPQRLLLKFKEGEARAGYSGAPLLNVRTGAVCGMIQMTRGSDRGGRAIPTSVIVQKLPDLVQQQHVHQQDTRWAACLTSQQRRALGLITSQETQEVIEVFYSYAEPDEKWAKELQKHLILLKRQNIITDWHPGLITLAGETPDEQVMKHLNAAHIILLLVSPDFLFSETHGSLEVERAMERRKAQEAVVIPINLRPIDNWQGTPFGGLQALPRKGKAVVEWPNYDAAFAEIARDIRQEVERLRGA